MSNTWQIRLHGQVQGVGFRPFVWKAAVARGLTGQVANGLQGVDIRLNASAAQALDFQDFLLKNAPPGSRILTSSLDPVAPVFFDNFSIQQSSSTGTPTLVVTPDVAVCPACLAEMRSSDNRRHAYAFTTCTYCGPRFSVLMALPYDRAHTTMQSFEMCPDCQREYDNPADRRFFAQTNSCPACGVQMALKTPDGHTVSTTSNKVVDATLAAWAAGQIVAIKSIGGYLLTCDATNAAAVKRLRERKQRPTKPLALLYPTLDTLRADVRASAAELATLQNASAPIVLLDVLPKPPSGLALEAIAPGLDKIGAMLPCAPLLALLLDAWGRPVVATSANVSHAPLVFRETDLAQLKGIADLWLTHNRAIATPQDDSVVALVPTPDAAPFPVVIRRSRGMAPAVWSTDERVASTSLLALGAEMKGAFTLSYHGNLWTSQYLGDLDNFDNQQRFKWLLERALEQLQVQPTALLGDLHPHYFSTRLGQHWASERDIPFYQIQHHEAHFAAVLAENALLDTSEPVLGVIWDGTGLGHDGQVWGGEFFCYTAATGFARVGHLPYFPLLLADKMPREPRLSALALCRNHPGVEALLAAKFSATEWALYQKMAATHRQPLTSSVGRVFDAVASLLGLADRVSYEGEAALLLETAARRYLRQSPLQTGYCGSAPATDAFAFNWLDALLDDVHRGESPGRVAALFHLSWIEMVAAAAAQIGVQKIAFSGGVFQNTLLLELLQQHLAPHYQLFFHQQLSPNDENLSFGQFFHHLSIRNHVSRNSRPDQIH